MKKQVFGTKEWAEYSLNCSNGCINNCRYCYAKKMAIRYGRKKPYDWEFEEIKKKNTPGFKGRVMIPTTHDITPNTYEETSKHIINLLTDGNDVLVVSKPRIIQIKKLINCIEMSEQSLFDIFKNKIMFRFSIGSPSDDVLRYWEPNAPSFSERLECLNIVYENGYQTSVSAEPMLCVKQEELFNAVKKYVTDSVWFGKMNNHNLKNEKKEFAELIIKNTSDDFILNLYNKFKNEKKIKWKESIKKVVGIDIPIEKGLDI